MGQHIPGTINVEGREFLYVEIRVGEQFRFVIDNALAGSPDLPLPKSGGVIEEKVRIILDSSTSLLGISYKGDVPAWRAKVEAYCNANHRRWGIVSAKELILSDGTKRDLGECEVVFDS